MDNPARSDKPTQLELDGLERERWLADRAADAAVRDARAAAEWREENTPAPPPPAREVSIRELDRRAGSVIAEVTDAGSVVAVTRWGLPVALILPLAEAIRLLPSGYVMSGELGELSRQFVARLQARDRSKRFHGREERWWED